MDKPTYEEFFTYLESVEYDLPLREKMARACFDRDGKTRLQSKYAQREIDKIETIKKVSEWFQNEHLPEDDLIRYAL